MIETHLHLEPGAVRLDGISKSYGNAVAVRELSLAVAPGEILALLGPSGCGKTTTLRMIAGLVEPSTGEIFIAGRPMSSVPVPSRGVGILFQNYALFPHLTVQANVRFGLSTWKRRTPKAKADPLVAEALRLVRLDGFEGRYPAELSGGQQQRVALARALVVEPAVLLLDEPLAALDKALRVEMQTELRSLIRRLGLTTILVTHDQEEAMTMADRIAVMDHGRIAQLGTAADLYERPATAFIADFVGTTNLLRGTVDTTRLAMRTHMGLELALASPLPPGPAAVALRPERVRLSRGGPGVAGRVETLSYRGPLLALTISTDGEPLSAAILNTGTPPPAIGEPVVASWDPADLAPVKDHP